MKQQMSIQEAMGLLEMPIDSLPLQPFNSRHEAVKFIDEFKNTLNKQRKILAKKYHPDIGGDSNIMQRINNVIDTLLKIEIRVIQPKPTFVRIYRTNSSATSSFSNTWTSTTVT